MLLPAAGVIHHDHYVDTFGLIPFQGFFKLVSFSRFQKLFKDQPQIQFNREVSVEDTDVQKSNQLLNSLDSHYFEQGGLLADFLLECTHDSQTINAEF